MSRKEYSHLKPSLRAQTAMHAMHEILTNKELGVSGAIRHAQKLANDPATAEKIQNALTILNRDGERHKADTGEKFVRLRTEEKDILPSDMSILRQGFSVIRGLNYQTKARDGNYGKSFQSPKRKALTRHYQFTIELEEFNNLCREYEVKISPRLRHHAGGQGKSI